MIHLKEPYRNNHEFVYKFLRMYKFLLFHIFVILVISILSSFSLAAKDVSSAAAVANQVCNTKFQAEIRTS